MDFLTLMPLAFAMIAGPQIISAFFFATSESWRASSTAYVIGAIVSVTLVTGAAYLLGVGATGSGNTSEGTKISPIDAIILVLLLFAMFHQFRGRHQTEPPKWMGKLESATPKFALVLGLLLFALFPADLVIAISIGGHTADRGDSYTEILPFIGLTALLLAVPALLVVLLGKRSQTVLPKIRDWMDTNSWIISEIVLVFFIVLILAGG